MTRDELVERLAIRANQALRTQLDGQPAPGREWDPTSWAATGGEINISAIVEGCLAEIEAMGLRIVPKDEPPR